MANFGRVKHRRRHVSVREGGRTFDIHVGVSRKAEYRGQLGQKPGSRSGQYNAVACIKSKGEVFRRGAKKNRCGTSTGSSPTAAIKGALTNLVRGVR